MDVRVPFPKHACELRHVEFGKVLIDLNANERKFHSWPVNTLVESGETKSYDMFLSEVNIFQNAGNSLHDNICIDMFASPSYVMILDETTDKTVN